jgi:hypothetical protein
MFSVPHSARFVNAFFENNSGNARPACQWRSLRPFATREACIKTRTTGVYKTKHRVPADHKIRAFFEKTPSGDRNQNEISLIFYHNNHNNARSTFLERKKR